MRGKRKLLADWMKHKTARLRRAYPSPDDTPNDRPTNVQREARAALQSLPVEAREPMRRLLAVMSGIDIPVQTGPRDAGRRVERYNPTHIEGGEIMVPTASPNGHSYPIGDPVLMLPGRMRGIRMDTGMLGNALPEQRDALRPATDAEIERFAASVPLAGSGGSDPGETFGFLCSFLAFVADRSSAEIEAVIAAAGPDSEDN